MFNLTFTLSLLRQSITQLVWHHARLLLRWASILISCYGRMIAHRFAVQNLCELTRFYSHWHLLRSLRTYLQPSLPFLAHLFCPNS